MKRKKIIVMNLKNKVTDLNKKISEKDLLRLKGGDPPVEWAGCYGYDGQDGYLLGYVNINDCIQAWDTCITEYTATVYVECPAMG